MMRVLRVYTPGNRSNETGVPRAAYRWLESTMGHEMPMVERATLGPYGYRAALREFWESAEDLCILEQDLIPTPAQLRELAACPHWLCAFAYRLYKPSLGRDAEEFAHRIIVPYQETPKWIEKGVEFADYAGFGLTKMGKYARVRIRPEWDSEMYHHTNLDTLFSRMFHEAGGKFHIHWPDVAHLHR